MTLHTRRKKHINEERIIKQVQKLLKEKGEKAEKIARKLMLENGKAIQCAKAREALQYFATQYWTDLVRPSLMNLVCESLNGDCQLINSIAVPIMLIAGGVDIHDDIIDQSVKKNERLTVFGKFGKEIALLAGDALIFSGFTTLHSALAQIEPTKAAKILRTLNDMFFELGDAEALELKLRSKINVDPEEYMQIIKRKAADVEAYTHITAILCNADDEQISALREYGRILGMLAILRDDLIDLNDREEFMHRLKHEVLPLPIYYAAQNPKVRIKINTILSKKQMTVRDIDRIVNLAIENRGIANTEKKIDSLIQEALSHIRKVGDYRLQLLINITRTT